MIDKWLTLKKDKETNKVIGFAFQGEKEKHSKEQILELCDKWKNTNSTHNFYWELCEDEETITLCSVIERSREVFNYVEDLNEVLETLSDIETAIWKVNHKVHEFLVQYETRIKAMERTNDRA